MHFLFGILVAAILSYLVYRAFLAPAASSPSVAAVRNCERSFAYLSNGLIFYRERDGAVKQVHSLYAQAAADQRERARERHGWKQGTSFGIAAGGGMRSFEGGEQAILATSAAFDADGNLLYFLKDATIGGLFSYEIASAKELRLLLKQGLHLCDLSPSPDGSMVAACSVQSNGRSNIALLKSDGSAYRDLTGGDSVDSAPTWVPGSPNCLLFQSAGLARNEQGYIVAQGHATIQKLDTDSGRIEAILDDASFDYLRPRVGPAGNLLFIRRPFESPHYGLGSMLADSLLFPFRLLGAVFHYLNFFSLMYARKPLTSANGPAVQADIKNILLQGRRIDAEKALRSARPVQGVPSLVPDSWVLVSRNQQGVEQVLATNVASYDISPDGALLYSNGQGVFVLDTDGVSRLALTNELVAEVVAASS